MKKLVIGLCVIGAALIAAAFWMKPASRNERVRYTEAPLAFGDLAEVVSTSGPLSPQKVTLVSSLVPGQVVKIFPNADFNRYVEEGEPLLQLDDGFVRAKRDQAIAAVTAAKADLASARSAEKAARKAYELEKKRYEQKVGQESTLLKAEYELNAAKAKVTAAEGMLQKAKASLKEAELGLRRTIVRAPVAGIIIDRKVREGQMVGPTAPEPLFIIAHDLGKLQINAQVIEGDVSKVSPGMRAKFTIAGFDEAEVWFEGTVKQVRYMPTNIPGAPPGVVYYTTVIEVDNQRSPKGWRHVAGAFAAGVHGPLSLVPFLRAEPDFSWILRPGMTATVDIIRRKHRNVWKLPTEALNQLPDRSFVSSAAWRRWKEEEPEGWNTVWILDKEKGPQPVFVRVRGVNAQGETGIRDGQYNEVLEWEKGFTPSPDNPPKVIISFPQIEQGIFDKPTKIGLG